MIGTWKGCYQYDNQQIQNVIGFEKTNFTIEIHKFDGVNFEGVVSDDLLTGGFEAEGTIKGILKNSKISFVKQMPKESLINIETGERYRTDKKHSPLYYEGIIDNNKFKGTWKFKKRVYLKYGIIPFLYNPGEGKFEMEKII